MVAPGGRPGRRPAARVRRPASGSILPPPESAGGASRAVSLHRAQRGRLASTRVQRTGCRAGPAAPAREDEMAYGTGGTALTDGAAGGAPHGWPIPHAASGPSPPTSTCSAGSRRRVRLGRASTPSTAPSTAAGCTRSAAPWRTPGPPWSCGCPPSTRRGSAPPSTPAPRRSSCRRSPPPRMPCSRLARRATRPRASAAGGPSPRCGAAPRRTPPTANAAVRCLVMVETLGALERRRRDRGDAGCRRPVRRPVRPRPRAGHDGRGPPRRPVGRQPAGPGRRGGAAARHPRRRLRGHPVERATAAGARHPLPGRHDRPGRRRRRAAAAALEADADGG